MTSLYTVYVDDNFNYMDDDARTKYGEYATLEEAVQVCEAIVDRFLAKTHKPGMSARQLYKEYIACGDDPFLQGPDARFSAWTYAKQRCEALCGDSVEDA